MITKEHEIKYLLHELKMNAIDHIYHEELFNLKLYKILNLLKLLKISNQDLEKGYSIKNPKLACLQK